MTIARDRDRDHDAVYHEIEKRNEDKVEKRNEQNKILQQDQTEIIHTFIRSLLIYHILSTKSLIFNAIRHLKRLENFDFQDSSQR